MAITISIDVTKIDRSRIKPHQNGARYLTLRLIDTPDSQYGDDFMVVHDSKKEERENGYQSPILGNGKDWSREGQSQGRPQRQQAPQRQAPAQGERANDINPDDDIPF